MNERIQELLKQSGVLDKHFNPVAYEQWYLDSLEKFAELIIKDTLQVARAGVEYGDGMDSAVYTYFGLKK